MEQTIEEILGVGTRISPQTNEDFALIKVCAKQLHFIEIIVYTIWDFELTLHYMEIALSTFTLKKLDCIIINNTFWVLSCLSSH